MNKNTRQLVLAAIFAAMIFAATFWVKIPMPATQGYVHIGDGIVFLSGIALGPVYAAAASGIGGLLSDVIGGYALWSPWTFVIKALAALCVYYAARGKTMPKLALGVAGAVLVNIAGYYVATLVMISPAVALVSIWENLMQEGVAVVLFAALYPIWKRVMKAEN